MLCLMFENVERAPERRFISNISHENRRLLAFDSALPPGSISITLMDFQNRKTSSSVEIFQLIIIANVSEVESSTRIKYFLFLRRSRSLATRAKKRFMAMKNALIIVSDAPRAKNWFAFNGVKSKLKTWINLRFDFRLSSIWVRHVVCHSTNRKKTIKKSLRYSRIVFGL